MGMCAKTLAPQLTRAGRLDSTSGMWVFGGWLFGWHAGGVESHSRAALQIHTKLLKAMGRLRSQLLEAHASERI